MTNLLVRLFVKEYQNTEQPSVRSAYGVLASLVGVVANVLLFFTKLFAGMLIHSIAVMADAFNNLSDAASSVIGFIGVKISNRPADKEHPFGHGRYEYIAALAVAFLVLQVGFSCFKSAFGKILKPEAIVFQPVVLGVLIVSILVKLWLSLFNRKLGKRINSTILKATATDAVGDMIVTGATVVSIIISSVFHWNVDGYIGIIVSVFVMIAGFKIAKETLEPLMGQAIDRELYETLTDKVESYEHIVGSHDLIIHSYGPTRRMATIHAEVPNNIDISIAHDMIDTIERDVLREMDIFLVIHMDPVEMNNLELEEKRKMVIKIIEELEPKAHLHDFRVVNGEHQVNIIFDLVLPFSYNKKEEQKILLNIMDQVREKDSRYQCVISVENSFIAEDE